MALPERTSGDPRHIAVVFGAGGDIGGALADVLRDSGHFAGVVGFSRRSCPAIDLLCESSLKNAAAFAAAKGDIRLVVDATGFLHDETHNPEKSWRDIDLSQMARSFALNAIGPALIMKHILPLLPLEGKSLFASLSARVGSISDNRLGGWYSYRASKAALNQLIHTASIELRRQRPQAICVALHPGTVDTRLAAPFRKTGLDIQLPQVASERLVAVMDQLCVDDSGGFFDHQGKRIPW
jgi:NAD(P)-dependent dehydrogenase (short-subunit alcohol dehydrogenase family)